ncbi:hypothetical protein BDN67DRAFT_476373 [Paxillus ammoniavirescens]|nr:hypothetical protein BDN67DRAFT_476373 [Paxillus ammoniavirescens]
MYTSCRGINEYPLAVLMPENQLSYETMKPLLAFSNPVPFKLVHKDPPKITLNEIEELASRWLSLENLVLNAEPLALGEGRFTLDLQALLPFARYAQGCGNPEFISMLQKQRLPPLSHQSSLSAPSGFFLLVILGLGTRALSLRY